MAGSPEVARFRRICFVARGFRLRQGYRGQVRYDNTAAPRASRIRAEIARCKIQVGHENGSALLAAGAGSYEFTRVLVE